MFNKAVLANLLHLKADIPSENRSEVEQKPLSRPKVSKLIPYEHENTDALTNPKVANSANSLKPSQKSHKFKAVDVIDQKSSLSADMSRSDDSSTTRKKRLHKSRKRKSTDISSMKQPDAKNNTEPSLNQTKVSASNVSEEVDQVDVSKKKKRKKKNDSSSNLETREENSVQEKADNPLKMKLLSSRFRYINEQLYTTTSQEAMTMFHDDPSSFTVYHAGYRNQIEKWPVKPIDQAVQFVSKLPKTHVIVDMGCGEAVLSTRVPHKVHSYDLIALNKKVIQADMSNIPLKSGTADAVIFCLSLMGTNLSDFICEAHRLLKVGGVLWIAEVASRFHGELKKFCDAVESIGFACSFKDGKTSTHFITMTFKKTTDDRPISNKHKSKGGTKNSKIGKHYSKTLPEVTLAPCLYKKR